MSTLWFILIAFMLTMYVLLDGFDLGAGVIHLFAAKNNVERRMILQAIGPVWDGNEVWLIAAGGTLFFTFPVLYASSFSGFYLPLMMVLWLLILRGCSIEFRSHVESPTWKPLWDVLFTGSSLLLAVLLAYLSVVLLSRYQNFTMSLSAIAGLVVAIGITADSFIVYFERLRDEVREGKSLRPAVESGWKRARRTILVSDTVSFLAALLLWYFSISDVKGFAFTLGLTTLIDVVVVFLFTKPMVTILARTRFFGSGHRLSGLDPARLGARTPWRSGLPRTTARRARGT